jgi:penicillin amidase
MKKGILISLIFAFLFSFCFTAQAGQVTIFRDNYGIPHIFGNTVEEVFYGYGYALAQDRLFQMEILRRSYYGRTAEIYGSKMKQFDIAMRTNNLTKSEINTQMETHLKAEHKKALSGMAKGMNRYIDEALKDRPNLLPKEFYQYDFVPEKWNPTDISAVFLSIMGIFMDVSNESRNLDVLNIYQAHGSEG